MMGAASIRSDLSAGGDERHSLAQRPEEHWPTYAEDEIAAVAAVLRSGRVNQWTGPEVFAFEKALTERFGGVHGIALANGSVALELALRAFGVGPGDEVVTTPRTFAASAFCAMLVGATPVFADVDANSGNVTAETIAAVLTDRTKAIIAVHLGGWPVDMEPIMELARSRGIPVIEDCAQAHGAEIGGRTIGSFGDAAAFSFCQDKILTTGGEGGFVSFREERPYEWAWSFKDHGKNRRKLTEKPPAPGFRWVQDDFGTNWRLSGPQAAIGLVQLEKLDAWRELRTRNAMIWAEALGSVPGLRLPLPDARFRHAFYKLHAFVDVAEGAREARDEILRQSADAGLRVFAGSCSEVYREKAFAHLNQRELPVAHRLGETSLMVEVHPTLDPASLARRAEALAMIVKSVLS